MTLLYYRVNYYAAFLSRFLPFPPPPYEAVKKLAKSTSIEAM